ncbi:MAG: hypothetical protein M3Y87_21550 [Myxococcota bacterium]|nr:hypothetical protein [Myxococcota bacterium]
MRASESSLFSKLSVALIGVGLAGCMASVDPSAAEEALITTGHCQVRGIGALASGDAMLGSIRDESGTPVGAWSHTTSSFDHLVGEPDSLVCRINGSTVADVDGVGTWNGAAGHFFRLHVQDRGEPGLPERVPGATETRTLAATRTYSPSRWTDGALTFAIGATVAIPASMPVTVGNAGNQWTWLTFVRAETFEPVRCMYRGGASMANPRDAADIEDGRTVSLARCQRFGFGTGWESDPALVAGTELEVAAIELHVQHGSSRFPSRAGAETTVSVDLEVTPYVLRPRETDYYRIAVWDPAGTLVHFVDGDLVAGDLEVELLP